MEKSAVILGLSRQAKFLGLPMPYAMAVGAMTVLPFILLKPVWWFLTAPIWYGLARFATKLNPNGHHVFAVMMQVTPMAILRKERRHVS
jgi:type IV secretory pathway VirB3-like protein